MKIVITGGSGQVGGILARARRAHGDDVVIVSRGAAGDARIVAWDARTLGAWADEIDGADVVVNAGFRFEQPEWPTAVRDLVARWRAVQDLRRS